MSHRRKKIMRKEVTSQNTSSPESPRSVPSFSNIAGNKEHVGLLDINKNFESQLERQREEIDELKRVIEELRVGDKVTCVSTKSNKSSIQPQEEKTSPSTSRTSVMMSPEQPTCAHSEDDDLPKMKLQSFDGDVKNYITFIKQFELYVEKKTADPGKRLMLLYNLCTGRAQARIRRCIGMEPAVGYQRAREILAKYFGNVNLASQSLIDELLAKCTNIREESSSLRDLAFHMADCAEALAEVGSKENLDHRLVLATIVKGFPREMKKEWVTEADKLFLAGRDPVFDDLLEFVESKLRKVDSYFGRLDERPHERKLPLNTQSPYNNSRALAVSTVTKPCPNCRSAHLLENCPDFCKLTSENRLALAKRLRVCYNCLKIGHSSVYCGKATRCTEKDCGRKHHIMLHQEVEQSSGTPSVSNAGVMYSAIRSGRSSVVLATIPVRVLTPKGFVTTVAFLDMGADTSFISHQFVSKHGINMKPSRLNVSCFEGSSNVSRLKGSICLQSLDESTTIEVDPIYSTDRIPVEVNTGVRNQAKVLPHLKDIPFAEVPGTEVTILIGGNVPEAFWPLEVRRGGRKQPFAFKTLLGWVLFGPASSRVTEKRRCMTCVTSETDSITEQLKQLYDAEFSDTSKEGRTMSREDKQALNIIRQGITHVEGCFEVPLPWKRPLFPLPNNYEFAPRRSRLKKNDELCTRYTALLHKYMEKGYMELAPTRVDHGTLWYMPHHAVINPKKPEKLNIVFDCAAKCKGLCLNDAISTGCDPTTALVHVLLRFREGSIVVSGDVEDMSLRVRVPEGDRDALRILLDDNCDMSAKPLCYRLTVHPFGVNPSPFCAEFAFRRTAELFGHKYCERVENSIFQEFYVDERWASFSDSNTARLFVSEISRLLSEDGFRITKWISDDGVIDTIPSEDRAACLKPFDKDKLHIQPTLGHSWDTSTDEFVFSFQISQYLNNRRSSLLLVAGVYDLLGMIAMWLLPRKMLLQALSREKVDWDEPLSLSRRKELYIWLERLNAVKPLRIMRCVKHYEDLESFQLHLSDASEGGHDVAAYGRFKYKGLNHSWLLFSKSRVAPLKSFSIPRLELAATVLAVRIYSNIREALRLPMKNVLFWCDSAVVLYYIRNTTTRFSTFVANRLVYIHDGSSAPQFRYVPSYLNPDDYASRGTKGRSLLKRWLEGLEFLKEPESLWHWFASLMVDEASIARKKTSAMVNIIRMEFEWTKLWERYSTWMKLVRAVVLLVRTEAVLLSEIRSKPIDRNQTLSAEDLFEAEDNIARVVQSECWPEDVSVGPVLRDVVGVNWAMLRERVMGGSIRCLRICPAMFSLKLSFVPLLSASSL